MKGRLLTVEEVRKLEDGTKVWCEYVPDIDWDDAVKLESVEIISNGKFTGNGEAASIETMTRFASRNNVKVYEWLEEKEMKQYETWELLKIAETFDCTDISIEERPMYKNKDGDIVVMGENTESKKGLFTLAGMYYKGNLINETWTLEPQPVSFMEAAASGNKFRYATWVNGCYDLPHVIYHLGREYEANTIVDMMNEKKWSIDED